LGLLQKPAPLGCVGVVAMPTLEKIGQIEVKGRAERVAGPAHASEAKPFEIRKEHPARREDLRVEAGALVDIRAISLSMKVRRVSLSDVVFGVGPSGEET